MDINDFFLENTDKTKEYNSISNEVVKLSKEIYKENL